MPLRVTTPLTFVAALLLALSTAHVTHAKKTGWTLGTNFSGEEYGPNGLPRKERQAFVEELHGRGNGLTLQRCEGRRLSFVDGPEDDFWLNVPSVDTENSFHISWISWPNMEFSKFPVLMNIGMDGDYFDFDISAYYADLFKAKTLEICTAQNNGRCRQFSMVGFAEVVRFVCKK